MKLDLVLARAGWHTPCQKPPKPEPRRFPVRKHMTIALGILANDGLVLAADTEVSYGDIRKTEGAKVAVIEKAGLAVAGAGYGAYIDALAHELQRLILNRGSESIQQLAPRVQSVLVRFHYEHILPWNDADLNVWLLVALERQGRRALWRTDRTTMRPCICAAVGAGQAEADALFTEFFGPSQRPDIDLRTAVFIASYIAHLAKDRIPGCGKHTDIVLIRNGIAEQLSRGDVNMLEHRVEHLLELQTRVAQFAMGYIKIDNTIQASQEAASALANFFESMRQQYQRTADFRSTGDTWILGRKPAEIDVITMPTASVVGPLKASRPARRRTKRDR